MSKATYPNVPGIYRSKKQGIILTVGKNGITVETIQPEPEKIIDVDNNVQMGIKQPDKVQAVHKGIQFINEVLMGKEEK